MTSGIIIGLFLMSHIILCHFLCLTALISFSLESLRLGSSDNKSQKHSSKLGAHVHQHKVFLPADYGRSPISEEEMDIINVSTNDM